MQKKYKTDSLLDMIADFGEEGTAEILSSFSCPLNPEIESFLKEKAITFTKSALARTYIVYKISDGTAIMAGYFALTPKPVLIKDFSMVSKSFEKKVRWYSETYPEYDAQAISVYMIAQLSKNFTSEAIGLITGDELLTIAMSKIADIHADLGGKFVCVECFDTPVLTEYYRRNDFRRLQDRVTNKETGEYLAQLLRSI
jgi:hypothetical protein